MSLEFLLADWPDKSSLIAFHTSVCHVTNLIKPHLGKLILNYLIGSNCQEFRNGLLDSYFFKLTLGK